MNPFATRANPPALPLGAAFQPDSPAHRKHQEVLWKVQQPGTQRQQNGTVAVKMQRSPKSGPGNGAGWLRLRSRLRGASESLSIVFQTLAFYCIMHFATLLFYKQTRHEFHRKIRGCQHGASSHNFRFLLKKKDFCPSVKEHFCHRLIFI